jgi:hypothetical protein
MNNKKKIISKEGTKLKKMDESSKNSKNVKK